MARKTLQQTLAIQAGDSTVSRGTFSAYSFKYPHENAIGMLLDGQNGVTMIRPDEDRPCRCSGAQSLH